MGEWCNQGDSIVVENYYYHLNPETTLTKTTWDASLPAVGKRPLVPIPLAPSVVWA